jgi:hypothetical protein
LLIMSVIRPETIAPPTPIEILEHILARDDTPASATTVLGERSDPAARLCEAVRRYTDGLHVAAEHLLGTRIIEMLDTRADQVVPHLTNEPSWPTLRAHDQPGQHSCRQLRRSGNTTSTEVSPAAATTTSVILTSQSDSLLEPHVIAGTKIDSGCPNHPRSARTRHPAPAHRSSPPSRG